MLPALRLVAQEMVGEGAGEHRFAHGRRPDADTGVVAAFGRNHDFLAVTVDTASRRADRACRLDGESRDDVLTRRDAAEDAARVVREERHLAVDQMPTQGSWRPLVDTMISLP